MDGEGSVDSLYSKTKSLQFDGFKIISVRLFRLYIKKKKAK